MKNKKIGYALILSSFIFLFAPIILIFNTLYASIWGLLFDKDAGHVLSSPVIDFAFASEIGIILIVFELVVGILLFSAGIYVVRLSRSHSETKQ